MHSEPFGCGMMHWVEIKNNNNNNNAGISISPSRSWVLSLCLWCTGSPCRVKAGEPPAGWGSAACALLGAARELQTAPHVTVCISDDHWTTLPAASCSSSAARELLSSFPSLPPHPPQMPDFQTGGTDGCDGGWLQLHTVLHPNGFLEGESCFILKNNFSPLVSLLFECQVSFPMTWVGGRKGQMPFMRGSPCCVITPNQWQMCPLSSLR